MENKEFHQQHEGGGDNVARDKIVYQYGSQQIPKYLTNVPRLSEELVGREKDLARLKDQLAASQRVVVVNGMGGIGKTSLAMRYAQEVEATCKHVAWLEQAEDFASALLTEPNLAKNLGIALSGQVKEDVAAILNGLANREGPSLLVIDNAEADIQAYLPYLPQQNWQVLLTSRERLAKSEIFSLDFLPEAAAMQLFTKHYTLDPQEELIRKIVETVQGHTLTLEVLAKTAQNLEIQPLDRLVKLLDEKGLEIGKPVDFKEIEHHKGQNIDRLFPYLEAIFTLPDFKAVERRLLQHFLAMPPQFHTWTFMQRALGMQEASEEVQDQYLLARNKLVQQGWLIVDEGKKAHKMHRVIQAVLMKQMPPTWASLEAWLGFLTDDLLSLDETKDNPVDKFPWVPFGEYVLDLQAKGEQDEQGLATLKNNLALRLEEMGRYQAAAELLEQALASDLQHFGDQHPTVARSRSNLGMVYKDLGRYQEATALLKLALASDLKNLGGKHPNVAISRNNLGLVYKEMGQYEEAADLLEKALASDLINFGEQHHEVAKSRSNLAMVFQDLGRYQEAANLLEKVLTFDLKYYEEGHHSITRNRAHLGIVYCDLGRYQEATALLEQALAADIQHYGEQHPIIATRRNNLGLVYKEMGKYEAAAGLVEQALAADIQHYGEQHPIIATRYNNLAIVYQALGQYEAAAELLEQALASELKHYGDQHPSVARSRSNLAAVYIDLKRIEAAKKLLQQAYTVFLHKLGSNHPHTKNCKSWLDAIS